MHREALLLLIALASASNLTAKEKIIFRFNADRSATRRYRISAKATGGPSIEPKVFKRKLLGGETVHERGRMAIGMDGDKRILLWTSIYRTQEDFGVRQAKYARANPDFQMPY